MKLPMNAEWDYYRNVGVSVSSIRRKNGLLISSAELPGSRPAIQLASSARGFILQHITDRLNLICAQHNLNSPSKNVGSLMSLAFEVRA
jgi:hypothetical protein